MGSTLGPIVESVLVDNLNPPCELQDLSWIKPGRVAMPWLTDHTSHNHPEALKPFVDLAADMGEGRPTQFHVSGLELTSTDGKLTENSGFAPRLRAP